ncbi:glycosyltransferase family 2 protein [Flavobacterium taihuense]|uniref:Glycosyltransferase family 2 protein n=1 Tax=Flavobacterium taihuense TaxID=2857508 RepID=A0ABS6XUM9_9FLAO|nr:glycosyltransferase family 2 protein [Flavobacterium taihuense]MBW4360383.1 glycosyltransferase family 2 protein [Flavobacterium taihuense]
MEKDKKLISFLITHYNRPFDLMECIEAIKKINISNYEIVVCDDGSEDRNIKLLQGYEIDKLILAKVNQGLAANLNKGIEACDGAYIIYCQEDFVLDPKVSNVLQECFDLLENKKVDMVRFTSNCQFNKLITLTANISLIPKFSFRNFLLNYYQYSDHPFVTTKKFYENYGYYLENTSGRYGETEYAIRILKSNAKIGISNKKLASTIIGSQSVLVYESIYEAKEYKINKKVIIIARAFRLYLELILYNKYKRGLATYKNFRKL